MKPWRLVVLLGVVSASSPAQDWPQWRGPARDGHAASLPSKWPPQLKQAWKVKVGEGHSSPVVVGGKVYQHSRQGEQEVVSAWRLSDGGKLWEDRYPAPYEINPAARGHGKGPKSTPVAGGGKLCTLGISGILSCYDASSGKLAWRKDFSREYSPTSPLFGTAMSPLLDSGLLIAHVGGSGGGALTAFDAATGAVKWAWKGDGPAYTSPLIFELGGVRQVVTQSEKMIVSVDAASGKLLWSLPFTTPYVQNIVTPVLHKDLLILSGLRNPTMGVRARAQDGRWSVEKVWENAEASMYMSSPVLLGDHLFGFTNRNKGQLFLVEVATGKTIWTGEPRMGDNASLLAASSTVAVLSTDGALRIGRKTDAGIEWLRNYTVADSPTWAHAVPTGRGFLIKDLDSLAFWTAE